jgi:hypothetical protein
VVVRVPADAGACVVVNDIMSEPDAGALLREAGVESPRVTYFREDAATTEGLWPFPTSPSWNLSVRSRFATGP